jgi:3-phytase
MMKTELNLKDLSLFTFLILLLAFLIDSCNRTSEGSRKAGEHITTTVVAAIETQPTPQGKNDDSADDPAIWIHPSNPEKSVIIGTDKKGGLVTYNLNGEQLNYYSFGSMNNCDLRKGFLLDNDTIDILASSNRSLQSVSLFKISENGVLDSVHARTIVSKMSDEVYGLCMYQSKKMGLFYVFVNAKSGEVEQYELFATDNKVDARLVRSFKLGTQTEGMVADDEIGILYVGEEKAGIWKFDAEPDGSTEGKFISNSSEDNRNIKYDVEGLAIYATDSINGYLVASSQGNFSYAVFERLGENKYIGSFRITDGSIDGVEETDGLDITTVALPGFPNGMLVVQDGYNYDGRKKKSQNFKYISWEEIGKVLTLK